ncbi:MAG: hypothetical protein LBC38_05065 [Oscillospiraceae bacterium]|jgi:uncharacterized membrane protein|nr:hypothetical protein [Oscillospiraceae bacterium]
MNKKRNCGFLRFLGKIGVILSVISLIATIILYWDELTELFPWLPKISVKVDRDEIDDEFEDFADV